MNLTEDLINARLDVIQTAIGPSPTLEILTSDGEVICQGNLPMAWLTKAQNGQVSKQGKWEIPSSQSAGQASRYRIFSGQTAISGKLPKASLATTNIKQGQTVVIEAFSLSEAQNAH